MQPVWLCNQLCKRFEDTFESAQWRKVKQMQPVWFCILSSGQFEDTFENTQWRKDKQMQPVWFCIVWGRQFEETFENTQWRKDKQMQPVWLCMLWAECIEESFENPQWVNQKMQPMRLCILLCKRFEETFEKTQWGKIDQACAFLRIYDIQLSILIFNFCLVWLTDYPTRGGFAPLGKNKLIIMIIRTCTKSQIHLWCWWRWWWRIVKNTNSLFDNLSVGFYSVYHQGSWSVLT